MSNQPEYWQAGPINGIQPLLQPVAHAILQVHFELQQAVIDFPENLLWVKPAGSASVGFHIQHITGVIDRLFTYARGSQLSSLQFDDLNKENEPGQQILLIHLVHQLNTR